MGASAGESSGEFPRRPISLVIGLPPGGGADSLVRQLAKHMSEDLGQPVIVDYRIGAAGNIGAMAVARSQADGHTLFLAGRSVTLHKKMYGHMNYDFAKDLVPVGMVVKMPYLLVMGKHVNATTLQDAMDLARERAGSLTCASTGIGTTNHLLCESLQEAAGIELLHLPYKGAAPALTDMVGGRADFMFTSLASALPYLESDKVRCVAVMSSARLHELPDVPSIEEFGFMKAEGNGWFALVAPARTPSHVILRLNRSLNNALANDSLREVLISQGFVVPLSNNTPEALGAFMADEAAKWTEVLERRDISSVQ
ncbi:MULTISPECIES: tripartite tricarboxylate transporter substrate binding protein [unclassified Achromobacter]|uniref:Bug family tripartite tricarboxylate transporter substrate binding protein n=1 Tax=unclassified Achromobacter TaxID=2626865 RepID=UPI0021019AC5|nr:MULTISPECIES: tripartite tricarboxylate transporter substrate-binding protein [unclassified Achromobacter]